ncbi:MAG: c-type cytochrome [Gammaproteobacteria bacterium]|nr:c-type cytochrome [Gammaproteobacteria bacterium]MDH5802651.1 c-type cytochrome [Gammaproteobacteria bacterium]
MNSFKKIRQIALLWLTTTGLVFSYPGFAFDYYQPLPEQPMIPGDNPLNAASIRLGKKLFYDTALSPEHTHSCNSCHNLLTGGDDDQAVSQGVNGKYSKRSAPGLWNIGLQTVLFWDGRAKTLEQQSLEHIPAANILNMKMKRLSKRLQNMPEYVSLFKQAFNKPISPKTIAQALAGFQRSLMAHNSPFDRYIKGDKTALSPLAIEGMQQFNDVGCLACHFGTNFAGPAPGPAMGMGDGFYELFPNHLGSRYDKSHQLTEDVGRMGFSKDPADKYLWRVPPLRNIAITGPYFHNGSAKTLREAVKIMAVTQLQKELSEKQLDQLVAFLNSLTGEIPEVIRKH